MSSNSIFDIFGVGSMDSGVYLNYDGFNDSSNAGQKKNELREVRTKLKAEKEKLEQQLNAMSMAPPGYIPHATALRAAAAAAFAAQASATGNKGMTFSGYTGIAMWQYMPPANTNTSQDSKLRPPAA